jgi:hypothetical protein
MMQLVQSLLHGIASEVINDAEVDLTLYYTVLWVEDDLLDHIARGQIPHLLADAIWLREGLVLGLINHAECAHVLAEVEVLLLLIDNKFADNVIVLLDPADGARLDLADDFVLIWISHLIFGLLNLVAKEVRDSLYHWLRLIQAHDSLEKSLLTDLLSIHCGSELLSSSIKLGLDKSIGGINVLWGELIRELGLRKVNDREGASDGMGLVDKSVADIKRVVWILALFLDATVLRILSLKVSTNCRLPVDAKVNHSLINLSLSLDRSNVVRIANVEDLASGTGLLLD